MLALIAPASGECLGAATPTATAVHLTRALTLFALMTAFANGCTAMTASRRSRRHAGLQAPEPETRPRRC
jgi:hypothetical protein